VWLADETTGMRISSLRTLKGTEDVVRLDTVGQGTGSGSIRDDVDVVVAPPDGSIAMPRLQSLLIGGAGLGALEYKSLPVPATLTGVVAVSIEAGHIGIQSRLSFSSTRIQTIDDEQLATMRYETTVSTDDSGHFATVLPPGTYQVTIEPAEGTGFGKVRKSIDIPGTTAVELEPPRRTNVHGRALLSDGRPLSQADIVASPSASNVLPPRAASTRTAEDGSFQLEVDQGTYEVRVVPAAGTGFPRYVAIQDVSSPDVDLGNLTVPAPMRLAFTIKDPSTNSNPIVRAVVRIFTQPTEGAPAIELGMTTTDLDGYCEILLAEEPR
jgi:hypothetical protein